MKPKVGAFKRIASDFGDQILHQALQKLEAFKVQHLKGVRIANASVVIGTHYKHIVEYAETEKIDLIIMGTGTTVQKMMFGSVAEKVSRLTNVPVMLVKGS